jgi:hydroxymethylbilane synthase
MAKLRIGSRGSQLALWQANHISALLRARGHELEIEIIHTTGDKITDVALAMVGTKGMFTKEIEEALAAGRVDLAVHSLKDLPTELPAGFEIAAITERQDPRDAFCSRIYSSVENLRSSRPFVPISIFIRCAGTWIRDCANLKKANMTRSF